MLHGRRILVGILDRFFNGDLGPSRCDNLDLILCRRLLSTSNTTHRKHAGNQDRGKDTFRVHHLSCFRSRIFGTLLLKRIDQNTFSSIAARALFMPRQSLRITRQQLVLTLLPLVTGHRSDLKQRGTTQPRRRKLKSCPPKRRPSAMQNSPQITAFGTIDDPTPPKNSTMAAIT